MHEPQIALQDNYVGPKFPRLPGIGPLELLLLNKGSAPIQFNQAGGEVLEREGGKEEHLPTEQPVVLGERGLSVTSHPAETAARVLLRGKPAKGISLLPSQTGVKVV